ncbi:MAG: hypothetical protein ABDH20_09615 [Thermus sp.]
MSGKLVIQAHPLALDGPEVLVRMEGEGIPLSLEGLSRLGVKGFLMREGRLFLLVRRREQVGGVVLGLVAAGLRYGLEVAVDPLAQGELLTTFTPPQEEV